MCHGPPPTESDGIGYQQSDCGAPSRQGRWSLPPGRYVPAFHPGRMQAAQFALAPKLAAGASIIIGAHSPCCRAQRGRCVLQRRYGGHPAQAAGQNAACSRGLRMVNLRAQRRPARCAPRSARRWPGHDRSAADRRRPAQPAHCRHRDRCPVPPAGTAGGTGAMRLQCRRDRPHARQRPAGKVCRARPGLPQPFVPRLPGEMSRIEQLSVR